jgi:hypothetical protein
MFAHQILINALGLSPDRTAASMTARNGAHKLGRPAAKDPGSGMAGFGSNKGSEPESGMAGFAAGSTAEPGSTLAGFEPAKRRCRPTVSRWIANSRAMRRCDQPCAAKVVIECCRLTLS